MKITFEGEDEFFLCTKSLYKNTFYNPRKHVNLLRLIIFIMLSLLMILCDVVLIPLQILFCIKFKK